MADQNLRVLSSNNCLPEKIIHYRATSKNFPKTAAVPRSIGSSLDDCEKSTATDLESVSLRGYLAGSAGKNIRKPEPFAAKAPAGLQLASELPKANLHTVDQSRRGHDRTSLGEFCANARRKTAKAPARSPGLQIYDAGKEHAVKCGIIVAAQKFEFGFMTTNQLILIVMNSYGLGALRFVAFLAVRRQLRPGEKPSEFR